MVCILIPFFIQFLSFLHGCIRLFTHSVWQCWLLVYIHLLFHALIFMMSCSCHSQLTIHCFLAAQDLYNNTHPCLMINILDNITHITNKFISHNEQVYHKKTSSNLWQGSANTCSFISVCYVSSRCVVKKNKS